MAWGKERPDAPTLRAWADEALQGAPTPFQPRDFVRYNGHTFAAVPSVDPAVRLLTNDTLLGKTLAFTRSENKDFQFSRLVRLIDVDHWFRREFIHGAFDAIEVMILGENESRYEVKSYQPHPELERGSPWGHASNGPDFWTGYAPKHRVSALTASQTDCDWEIPRRLRRWNLQRLVRWSPHPLVYDLLPSAVGRRIVQRGKLPGLSDYHVEARQVEPVRLTKSMKELFRIAGVRTPDSHVSVEWSLIWRDRDGCARTIGYSHSEPSWKLARETASGMLADQFMDQSLRLSEEIEVEKSNSHAPLVRARRTFQKCGRAYYRDGQYLSWAEQQVDPLSEAVQHYCGGFSSLEEAAMAIYGKFVGQS